MSRKSGKIKRIVTRFFKERQIYHRSDGVVHFISMSTNTQIALAAIVGAALLWIAYASVNVVFKEQIIVAKDRDSRVMELNYSRRLLRQQQAYDDIDTLNNIMREQFDTEIETIRNRHDTLRNMVERSAAINISLEQLSETLSEAGAPNGQQMNNGNRIMIDVTPGETTPRRSRMSVLQEQALKEAAESDAENLPQSSESANVINEMEQASVDLYVEQMLLLAAIEEKATKRADELRNVIKAIGVNAEAFIRPAKIRNAAYAQGGPFIDPDNHARAGTDFFRHANRAATSIDELNAFYSILRDIPLSSPLTTNRRFTSGFGVRRDPISGRRSNHYGIDFAAPWASPVTTTANGIVKFAGSRSGFGRIVEIDHGNGFVTRYAHLHRYTVKKGQRVKLHDKIGELGSSGRSTGPHVHYEILYKGKATNPQRFIEAGRYVFES